MRKPLVLRRVHGRSMAPSLLPDKVVLATGWFREVKPGQIVVVHHDGLGEGNFLRLNKGARGVNAMVGNGSMQGLLSNHLIF